jgi:site-specific DNA recombinase
MPKGYFSYIRVSTVRQGLTGTSLVEQRDAIERYAARWGLPILKEFEEKETAARKGRPVFSRMLEGLKHGEAAGVIIHKIDRSARNLRDWAELQELVDVGIEIHFANENLDLYSRGGRLSADIQAVVAADYVRNLREEVKKGIYGRIRQGIYPMPAPVGYVNKGKAAPKEPDPVQAPLVRQAFTFYATGRWPLGALVPRMYELGLRNRGGGKVTKNTLNKMLRNPFYVGVIRIHSRGELFGGKHQPIIPKLLFDRVQSVLDGKRVEQRLKHFFLFRRMLRCEGCGKTLIGETQKGYNYYRCQTKGCPQKTIREEAVELPLRDLLREMKFSPREQAYLRQRVKRDYGMITTRREELTRAQTLQVEQLRSRLSKLADAYIDGVLDKETYLTKKNELVLEEKAAGERLERLEKIEHEVLRKVENFLELINSAYRSYKLANREERRELAKTVTSNIVVSGKKVSIKPNYPFRVVLEHRKMTDGRPKRDGGRTLLAILRLLKGYFKDHQWPPWMESSSVHQPFSMLRSQCQRPQLGRFAAGRADGQCPPAL